MDFEKRIIDGVEVEKTIEEWDVYDACISPVQQNLGVDKSWEDMSFEEAMFLIRQKRNELLTASDSMPKTSEVLSYRRSLRKFPKTITEKPESFENIQYPEVAQ